MTDYLTLTEFVPGTKAKAQEVNANFVAVKDAIDTKVSVGGDSTKTFSIADATEDSHAVSKSQLDTLSTDFDEKINAAGTRFCAKSGNVTSGKADLFSYSLLSITPKIGGSYANLIISDCDGTFTTISSATAISMSGKADGVYNIYAKPDGTFYTLANNIYAQTARPTLIDGDIWVNTSVEPMTAIKYASATDAKFLDVPVGKVTIASSAITALTTNTYNQNGYDVNIQSNDWSRALPKYASPISKVLGATYTAECDGWLSFYCAGAGGAGGDLLIDSVNVLHLAASGSGVYVNFQSIVPISKGSSYYTTGNGSLIFYPAKGAS